MDTKRLMNRYFFVLLAASALAWGCDGDPEPVDSGMEETDAGGGDTDAGGGDTDAGSGDTDGGTTAPTDCERYCDALEVNCTGENAQYDDRADCLAYCGSAGWPVGTEGETGGNTIECRIYHSGAPAAGNPATHCPHTGPTGANVCGSIAFRTDDAAAYTRVDRMGMPAVSTALIGSDMKEAYNDASPTIDATVVASTGLGTFVPELAENLTAIHTALDDDLTGLGLTPCSMTEVVGGLPECFGQTVGVGGPTVASLVVPDTLQIDPSATAGFPNGRALADPVIDVTLAVILLELGGSCGTEDCSATTFASIPLNPAANDVAFLTEFPYLAAPHTP